LKNFPGRIPLLLKTNLFYGWQKNLPEGMCLSGRSGGIFEALNFIFGYETICYKLHDDRDLVLAVKDKIYEIELAKTEFLLSLDIVKYMFPSDDLGFRSGLLVSPQDIRQFSLTCYKKIVQKWHEAGRLVAFHTCGQENQIYEDLIDDVIIDAIHSFENTIEHITDTKCQYGNRLSVIRGIDVDFLCRNDEMTIRKRVCETLDICHLGGGYALGTGNTVANYIPLDNYLTMLDEGRLWRS
jgi:uroporphyrinogen decarboxylase